MELSNNTILVTGGTSGFGFEFASKLITLGNTVIITGRNAQKLLETKQKLPAVHTIQSDVSKSEDIINLYEQVTQQFPDLNILINNAGEMRKLILHDAHTLDDITREVEINLMGPIRMIQQFLPHLKKQNSAAIMNVTSGIALMPFPISPVYGASKSGLRSYTKSLRVQLKHTNVKVFELVAPGSSTPLNDKFKDSKGFNDSMLMAPEKIIDSAIKGIKNDTNEIYPGLAKVMRVMSRIAPAFMLAQAGKMGQRKWQDDSEKIIYNLTYKKHMKIISGILILITAFLSLKHGWEGLHLDSHPEQIKMATDLGVGKTGVTIVSILSLVVGVAILFPQTFFIANLVNAITIVLIMAFSLKAGNYKMALMEIPFLLIPMVLIYLGHPFKK